jgi:hypothetical protein
MDIAKSLAAVIFYKIGLLYVIKSNLFFHLEKYP